MSNLRNTLLAYAMFAASIPDFSQPTQKRRKSANVNLRDEIDFKKSKGMNQFFYGQNSLWAINQKNADRKAKSLNLL